MQPIRVDETVRSMSIAQALRTEQAHSQAPFTLDGLEIGSVRISIRIYPFLSLMGQYVHKRSASWPTF